MAGKEVKVKNEPEPTKYPLVMKSLAKHLAIEILIYLLKGRAFFSLVFSQLHVCVCVFPVMSNQCVCVCVMNMNTASLQVWLETTSSWTQTPTQVCPCVFYEPVSLYLSV